MNYENYFNEILYDWQNKLKYLTKLLIKDGDINSLIYLDKNYNIQDYLSYYAGVFPNIGKKLINLNLIENYYELAIGAVRSGNLDMLIIAFEHNVDNYQVLALKAIKYNKFNIVEYILGHYEVDLDTLYDQAVRYSRKNIIKYIQDFQKRIGSELFDIPNEILFNILIHVPEITKIKTVNKNFGLFIKSMIKKFNKSFEALVSNWKENLKELVRILVYRNSINSLLFLSNNYNIQKYLSFYAGYYGNHEILNLNIIKDFEELAQGAAQAGRGDILNFAIERGAKNYEKIAQNAALGGKLKYVKFAISRGAINIPFILNAAAEGGSIKVIDYLIKTYGNLESLSTVGYIGALYNHFNVVQYAIDRGAMLINFISYGAAKSGNKKILDYLFTKGADDYSGIAVNAADAGHLNIVKLAWEKGARNVNDIMAAAAKYPTIVKWAEEHGANDYQALAESAAYIGDLKMVEYAVSKGAHDFNRIATQAALNNKLNVLKYAIENRANNLEEIKSIAFRYMFNDITVYINNLLNKQKTITQSKAKTVKKKLSQFQ